MKIKLQRGQIVQSALIALLLALMIAVNVVLTVAAEPITIFFGGYGIDFAGINYEQGNQLVQDITGEGIVLLRNENNALPLTSSTSNKKNVSIFGWSSTDKGFMTSGAGSGSSADRGAGKLTTFLQALEGKDAQLDADGNEIMPKVEGRFNYYKPLTEMYTKYKSARNKENYWGAAYPFFNLIEPSMSKVQPYMKGAAEFSDTAIVVITRLGGEGQDMPRVQVKVNPTTDNPSSTATLTDDTRTYLEISQEEEELLKNVRDNFAKVVVIINATNTMELDFLEKYNVDAALSVGGTGQSGTIAIAKVLTGEITPSGKTVDTYAYDHSTAATYANGPDCRDVNGATGGVRTYTNGGESYVDYAEGIYVGYKWYETANAEGFWSSEYAKNRWNIQGYDDVVQYPFGFGLSYTDFEWAVESVSPKAGSAITDDTDITLKVRVSNLGTVPGKDVVEIYASPEYHENGIEKSALNLIAFAKTEILAPAGENGDTQLLTITFKAEDMKSFDYNDANKNGFSGYEMEAGNYEISLRSDAHTLASAKDNTIQYQVKTDIKLEKDSVTGTAVENIFTGDKGGDVSIDGTTTGANILYLNRSNFENTFPAPRERREKNGAIPENGWKITNFDTTEEIITDTDSGLRFYNEDGSINKTLLIELGANFNDQKWELLLDQLTKKELNRIILDGGYQTTYLDSIAKPAHTDLDGPSGLNQENMTAGTVSSSWSSFPVETVLAQTWNAKMSYTYGLTVGNEAYSTHVAGWYAPAANIHRSPYDGRNFEYYSEDALLSGIMCAETVRGATNTGLYCYVKHFAVNETELNREGLYTWLNEQSLREIYLRPFEIAVKQGYANAIMSSFNRIGATWAGGNYKLLTTVLRKEWGFNGSVVTDYAGIGSGAYMNTDQMIRSGGDFMLDGTRNFKVTGYSGFKDLNSPTSFNRQRAAAKNILFTYANTVYRQDLFTSGAADDEDAGKYATEVGSKQASQAAGYWKYWGWLPLDVVGFGGIIVWSYFCFFHKKKEKETIEK